MYTLAAGANHPNWLIDRQTYMPMLFQVHYDYPQLSLYIKSMIIQSYQTLLQHCWKYTLFTKYDHATVRELAFLQSEWLAWLYYRWWLTCHQVSRAEVRMDVANAFAIEKSIRHLKWHLSLIAILKRFMWFTHCDTQNSLYVAHNSFNYVFL